MLGCSIVFLISLSDTKDLCATLVISSMKGVAGCFVPMDVVHNVLATLGVDPEDVEDNYIEDPINDWLADQNKDILAAIHDRSPRVGTPDELG